MLVDRALVSRIEGRWAQTAADYVTSMRAHDPTSDAVAVPVAGGFAVYLGPGMFINRAMGMGVGAPAGADDVDRVVDFFSSRDTAPEIELCPYADRSLLQRAGGLGLVAQEFLNIYARPLTGADLVLDTGPVEVRTVEDASIEAWIDLCVEVFPGPPPDVVRRFMAARHTKPDEHDFIASVDGAPAAICSVVLADRIADLGGMGTLPAARQQGVQQACIHHRLRLGAAAGCDLAVTSAVPGGPSARNLERAGFSCLYTSVRLRAPRR